MSSIQLKHQKSLKKLSINKNYSSEELGHLIVHIFKLKDKLVGVTDQNDRYFDLDYLSNNLKAFKSHTLTLVTYKDASQDNMSFASSFLGATAPQRNSKQDIPIEDALPQNILETDTGYMGHVESQLFFQNIFLQDGQTKVLLKTDTQKNLPKISIPYYSTNSETKSVILYNGLNKLCQLFLQNFENINQKISSVFSKIKKNKTISSSSNSKPIPHLNSNNSKSKPPQKQPVNLFKKKSSTNAYQRPITVDYSFQLPNKQVIIDQLNHKLQRGQIQQLQYFKLKCNLYEHPQDFVNKLSESDKQSSISIDDFRQQIIRSREQRLRYQEVLNSFQKPSRQIHNRNSEIPIIVRRNNNVIQKISTSYPISPEQEHSIHLIGELEFKGLISEPQAKFYKSLILYDNPDTYTIFTEYFNENIDQIELSKRLKGLKKYNYQQARVFDYGQPQPLSKLIQKTCSPSNIGLLTKLLVDCEQKILSAYDSYLLNRDEGLFGQTGDKIASYYRLKQDLQHLQQGSRYDNKKRKTSYKPNLNY